MTSTLLKPFYEIWFAPPRQWHPLLVHFPIAFLFVEAGLLGLFGITRKPDYDRWAYAFLHLSLWTMVMVVIAGLHDVGLDLGAGNTIWLGLQDRWHNTFRFQSSVTVHTWLAMALLMITVGRLIWRKISGTNALRGAQGWAYALISLTSLWVLSAAGYVGGLLSHK
jgi:uncharacterized membrane protein